MRVNASAVAKGAYRLPTESEWEYSCRAGTETSRYFGDGPDLLGRYECFVGNSGTVQHCGWRLPNELGLFDMLANVFEWCHERHLDSPPSPDAITPDVIDDEIISGEKRLFRGQTFTGLCRRLALGDSQLGLAHGVQGGSRFPRGPDDPVIVSPFTEAVSGCVSPPGQNSSRPIPDNFRSLLESS